MEANKLKEILRDHEMWVNNKKGGERAYLRDANLYGANLIGANLYGADLRGAYINVPIACPEKGSFIGFKKASVYAGVCFDDCIVELLITEDAKRLSATTRKRRCNKAKVLSITNLDGTDSMFTKAKSNHDPDFIYEVDKIVEVEDFDDNRWNECAPGIHFFITRQEAVEY